MADLLFWNTLIESVDWLNENQAEQFTPKSLIQKILDKAESAGTPFPPTIIKALLPRDIRIASVLLFPKNGDIGDVERRINERITEAYGEPFIKDSVYTGYVSAEAIPLYPAQIADLIKHENVEISCFHENQLGGYKFRDSEYGYILPIGTKHIATMETCGINRTDLLGLHGQLVKSQPPKHHATDINQQGGEANKNRYVVIKDLAWEMAHQLADKNRDKWSESDGDDHIRRTAATWINENGWELDGIPSLLVHIINILQTKKIITRSTFNGLPPTDPSQIVEHPANWYVSLADAEIIRRELLPKDVVTNENADFHKTENTFNEYLRTEIAKIPDDEIFKGLESLPSLESKMKRLPLNVWVEFERLYVKSLSAEDRAAFEVLPADKKSGYLQSIVTLEILRMSYRGMKKPAPLWTTTDPKLVADTRLTSWTKLETWTPREAALLVLGYDPDSYIPDTGNFYIKEKITGLCGQSFFDHAVTYALSEADKIALRWERRKDAPARSTHAEYLAWFDEQGIDTGWLDSLRHQTETVPDVASITGSESVSSASDIRYLSTASKLVEVFERFGLTEAKMKQTNQTAWLSKARKLKGQGGKKSLEAMYCPYEVMLGLVNDARPSKLSEDRGWEMLEQHFPIVYGKFERFDPRQFS